MTDISGPAFTRAKEHEKLPEAEAALLQSIVHYRKFTEEHASGSDKYKHIDVADVAKVYCTQSCRVLMLSGKNTLPLTYCLQVKNSF
jgi:hypothetical protein